ncbi:MAG: serine/threonine-protein kinase [Planctomycetota bacterium]|nr:serine/threonine-protein kinase [Planctomycetota bacterium]
MSQPAPPDEKPAEFELTGRQLGDYQLLRRLGRGAMAEVYLAEQGSLRRQVALKVLRPELATDQNYVRRFHLEAQAAASLVHANIVQIHEVGCIDGLHYIAQEYIQGQNLREMLQRRGLPDLKLAVSIMRQVCAALSKAADQGIVHRDIKPENIMITRQAEVKVADFGLARAAANGDGLNLTQAGVTMGTPLYMSPEQVEGRPLDPRSDLYALGVTCYHMLTGRPPFNGETALAVAMQHLRTPPERLENSRQDLPTGLCRIVHRMLAKEPAQRYEHPREIIRELRALQIETDVDSHDEVVDTDHSGTSDTMKDDFALTQELASLMKTQTMLIQDRRWPKYLFAAVVASALVGAAVAWWTREPFLLAEQSALPAIPQKATAEEQYQYALLTGNNAAAWEAVYARFPQDDKWGPLAKKQLASIYLQNGQYDLALKLFDQLTQMSSSETAYRAFGMAGQCIIYAIDQDNEKLNDTLDQFAALTDKLPANSRDSLLDPHMMALMDVILRNKKQEAAASTMMATEKLLEILSGSGNKP